MKQFVQNEEAVSPVIGVILMVAITVILAAVIAAFVFGMTGNVQSTKTVAVTATQQGANVIVTYQGGSDANQVEYLRIDVAGELMYVWGDSSGTAKTDAALTDVTGAVVGKLPVGSAFTFSDKGTSSKDHVVVAAHFSDGADQVILDTYV